MELKKDGFFNQIVKGICASEHGRTDLRVGRQRFLVCAAPVQTRLSLDQGSRIWIPTGAAMRTSFHHLVNR